MGMTLAPLVTTVLARVAPEHAGAAAGVLSAAQQVGNAVGVAVLGIVFYGATDVGSGSQLAFSRAFAASALCLVATELTLAATVQLIPRNLHR
jgi:predicted MFS family arabinose efflux permease